MGRPRGAQLLDGRPVAVPAVDADQHLDATAELLGKDRAYGFPERRADDRCHDDADVEPFLEVGLQGARKPWRLVGDVRRAGGGSASFKAANIPQEPMLRGLETVDSPRLIAL
jgi:hypothetical protein